MSGFILPCIIAAGLIALPLAVPPRPPPIHIEIEQEETDSNLNIWLKRLRCERFYTIEARIQCHVIAERHSEHDLAKRHKP